MAMQERLDKGAVSNVGRKAYGLPTCRGAPGATAALIEPSPQVLQFINGADYNVVMMVLWAAGEPAVTAAERAYEARPSDARIHVLSGRIKMRSGLHREAWTDFQKAEKLFSKDPSRYIELEYADFYHDFARAAYICGG